MSVSHTDDPTARPPLRLWPGIAMVVLQWIAWGLVPLIWPDAVPVALAGAFLGGVGVVVWWLLFSRAPWIERGLAIVTMAVAYVCTGVLLHESVATGAQGALFALYFGPTVAAPFVAWAVVTRGLGDRLRRTTMVATILLAVGAWTLVRTNGVDGSFDWDWAWRFSDTHESTLAAAGEVGTLTEGEGLAGLEPHWPGFRGPGRDGVVRGVRIESDWQANPPRELWRRPVGPGWSSFAVAGDLLFTQEQRGEDEVVAAYALDSGEPVWMHADRTRFWEAMSGAGPRGTPTVHRGRVHALGATGTLSVLDAATGQLVWARDTVADTEATIPGWGLASSPLVVDGRVVVAVAGRLAAYDAEGGDLLWLGEAHRESYASPHRITLGGSAQILLLTGAGITAVDPATGTTLWEHAWPGFHALQPALTGDGDLLVASSGDMGGVGTRRLSVQRVAGNWEVQERWTSIRLKPYYNDFVVHEGHAYGFDGAILAAMDVANGERTWKGGRYGHGQMLLLADQDLLLVISEEGELVLVSATPDGFREVARYPALQGKTWNHPVLVDDLLLVRNDREMAAFRLELAQDESDGDR